MVVGNSRSGGRAILGAMVLVSLVVGCGGGGSSGGGHDCAAVAQHISSVCTGHSIADDKAACEAVTCTGNKQSAIDCILGLGSCDETAYGACLTGHGCPIPK